MEDNNDDDLNLSFGDEEFGVGNSTFNSVVLNETYESSFEVESDVDNPDAVGATSTPSKKAPRFKAPKLPPPKYFKKCVQCGNFLKTERGFIGHMQTHRWKDAAALRPPVEEIIRLAEAKVPEIFDNIMAQFSASEGQPGHLLGIQVKAALGDIKANVDGSQFLAEALAFVKRIFSEKSASKSMPFALRTVIQISLSTLYDNTDLVAKLKDSLNALTTTSDSTGCYVIFTFIKKLTDTAFLILCNKIRGPIMQEASVPSKDDFNHYLSQQVVHYVSGSCMRTHFRNAYRHPKNTYMQNVKECILNKFATIGHTSVTDKKNPKYWTSLLNRKSLLFVKDSALPFFICLSKLLQTLESAHGSLNHEKVTTEVVASPALTTLWDAIVDNFLPDDDSFRFMIQVVRSLTNCFGKGVMLRRMNAKAKNASGNKSALAPSMRARLLGK